VPTKKGIGRRKDTTPQAQISILFHRRRAGHILGKFSILGEAGLPPRASYQRT
jgi:hypothetical protein